MQTKIPDALLRTPQGREAEAILRKCTHCGFCLANCPTYRLLGDELDSPRGRIYQIKQVLEGGPATVQIRQHLDRCLTCRACETTCPSGVEYTRLVDIGRTLVEERAARPLPQRMARALLRGVVTRRAVFATLLTFGKVLRPWLPRRLREHVPRPMARAEQACAPVATASPQARGGRRVLMLQGCVQPALAPAIDAATRRVLDQLGIEVENAPGSACCGALEQHLGYGDAARSHMRRNVRAWAPRLRGGADAIVVTASGCATEVQSYGRTLAAEEAYAADADHVARALRDPVELLEPHVERLRPAPGAARRIAFHAPCTLQHGLRLTPRVERLLSQIGFELVPVADAHICCGSAGSYSLLQPAISGQLREHKLAELSRHAPACIATANVGCLTHLQAGTEIPVRHWIELIDVVASAAE